MITKGTKKTIRGPNKRGANESVDSSANVDWDVGFVIAVGLGVVIVTSVKLGDTIVGEAVIGV